ncbi:MAG: magnesium transporter CorA family protein [Patescibacteria group bacterium]
MISRYTYKDLVWVDVQSPTQEEVRSLMEEFAIHPLVADELLGPTLRPKVDLYNDFIYLILHFPTITHKHDGGKDQEIDFVIGKKFIITAHYGLVDQLHEFSKVFEVNSILDKLNIREHAGFILFYILKDLYKMLDTELDHINHDFNEIQSKIFSGKERDMVNSISHINRDLLNFKQILRPHKEVLESFEVAGAKFFGKEFSYYLHTIVGEFYKVSSILDGHRETVLDLRDTNDSLLTTKTNDIMKTLTITAFILLPLTFIGQLFGMSFINTPLENNPSAFFITIIAMGVIGTLLFGYFKFFKKWM